jgi:hypothetical protein
MLWQVLAGESHLFDTICDDGTQPELPSSRPNRENDIWGLVKRCWLDEPSLRPGLEEIRERLKKCESEWDSEWRP